jgi:hypothetical protein
VRRIEQAQSGGAQTAVPDVTYEDVRQSFLLRLSSEHTRLVALAGALGSGAGDSAAFGDLEGFAHRLRGAAAVFDFPELREAAKALEMAANDAMVGQAPVDDPRVQTAIRNLDARLAWLNGNKPPTVIAMAPVTN